MTYGNSSNLCKPKNLPPGATVAGAMTWGRRQMREMGHGHTGLKVLLSDVMACSQARLIAHPETILNPAQCSRFESLIRRYLEGEPLAHLRGRTEFWSLSLTASPNALIPRPETELLVELAVEAAQGQPAGQLLDLGTGGGAIALAFGHEKPGWQVHGIDCSQAALAQAERDRARLGLSNVHFSQQHWNEAGGQRVRGVDIVVSNPPYIAADDPDLEESVSRYEPREALFAGNDGLSALHEIISLASMELLEQGALILEHGWRQRAAVVGLLDRYGFTDYSLHQDLAGRPRAVRAHRPPPSEPT